MWTLRHCCFSFDEVQFFFIEEGDLDPILEDGVGEMNAEGEVTKGECLDLSFVLKQWLIGHRFDELV